MKKMGRRGITLVSLVVTIIVLLILAGITINLIIGEDGIIKRAQQAGKNYIDAAENEKLQLGIFTNEMDNIITGSSNNGRTPYNSEFRKNVVEAIKKAGVATTENDTDETIVTNIGKILKEATKNATATADNISEGKTAWVNGELITGNGSDNEAYYKLPVYMDCIVGTSSGSYQYDSTYTVTEKGTYVFLCRSMAQNTNTNQTINGQDIVDYTKSSKVYSIYYGTNVSFVLDCNVGDTISFNNTNNGGFAYDCGMMVLKFNNRPDYLEDFHFTVSDYDGSVTYNVPEDGHYQFSAQVLVWNGKTVVEINGQPYRTHYMYIGNTGYTRNSVYFDLECKKGDIIKISNSGMYDGGLFVSRD